MSTTPVPDESGTKYQKMQAKWRKGRQELSNLARAYARLKAELDEARKSLAQCSEGILAKPEQAVQPRHPSFEPFKCPVCGSSYFGAIWKDSEHVGRYCKGWPSSHDRSYTPCRGKHEELFVAAAVVAPQPKD